MSSELAPLCPLWIRIWLAVSSVVCGIDVAFTMLRPASLPNGSLGWLFRGWHIYADIDLRYGTANDIVTCTTGRLMLIEIMLNAVALIMSRRQSAHTVLVAFTASILTFWKTVIYLSLYIAVPEGNPNYLVTEGTPLWKLLVVFWCMNSIWVVVPLLAIIRMWPILVSSNGR